MKCRKSWKSCISTFVYCRPGLNRWLLCLHRSMQEVCRILNADLCHGCEKGCCSPRGKCRLKK